MYKTEVSLDEFTKAFVPNLPENLNITHVLQRKEELEAWEEFSLPDTSPENVILRQLTGLFDEMMKSAQYVWKETCPEKDIEVCPKQRWSFIFITEPKVAPSIPSSFKPSAFFHRKEGSHSRSSLYYYKIAFTAESKRHSGTVNSLDLSPPSCILAYPSINDPQNIANVVYAMKHIIAVDARRRFAFGITIENTSMGLWYANRTMLIGSQPLDITTDKEHLLKMLLSFAFAPEVAMS